MGGMGGMDGMSNDRAKDYTEEETTHGTPRFQDIDDVD